MAADGPETAATRGERRRARTRAAIVDAAEEVFRREGFHATRVEAIAGAADVSVGTLYVHFPGGKQGLYLAVVDRALELFEQYMARSEDPAFTPLQRVLAGGDAYLRFHSDHPGLFQFLAFRSVADPAPAGSEGDATEARVRLRVGRLLERFAAQIDAAIAAGEVEPLDSARLTRYLWGAWNGVIALGLRPDGLRLSEEEIAETLELARWMLREAIASPALRGADGRVGDRVPLPHIAPPE